MKTTEYKDKRGRRALTSAIMSTKFLSSMFSAWRPEGLFKSDWENLVAKWCIDYYKEYNKAPRKNIQGLYQNWEEKTADSNMAEIIQKFLSGLSEEYEETNGKINSKYEIEQAKPYFLENEAKNLITKIQGAIDTKKYTSIEQHIKDFRAPNLGTDSDDINLFNDISSWECMFQEKEDLLIKYPGPLGEFFGQELCRGNFITFLAPEKRGKSFLLIDMAFQGIMNRRRVAMFQVGDMTRKQISRRFAVRVCENPWRPREVLIPTGISITRGKPSVSFKTVDYKEHLEIKMLEKGLAKIKEKIKSERNFFKLRVYPANSLTIQHLRNTVEMWARDGWVPDVIIVDYADILGSPYGMKDVREKINEIWVGLRALSQTMDCLVVTATQATRASYNVKNIGMEHTSEDKRKLSHVTGAIAINQTKEEKKEQVLRLGWVVLREDDFHSDNEVYITGSLALANPTMVSCFSRFQPGKSQSQEEVGE